MANVTITLTEKELQAFRIAKNQMDMGYQDNIATDEQFGDTMYQEAHAGLDSIEDKIEGKLWVAEQVALWANERPDIPTSVLRKMAKEAWNQTV